MKAYFKKLFEYDRWANNGLLEKFEHQFPQNPRIYGLLSHMISAQQIWLDRCLGLPQTAVLWAERLPDEIREDNENYHLAWIDFIDGLQDADFENGVTYTNFKGDTYTSKLSDILAHTVNHGTNHRGQILILMKEEGFVLPSIDYITFVR
jgi:uncharacterized damage-inducible protein DinB